MGRIVFEQRSDSHLVDCEMTPGTEIGLRVDQTLTQDATGTVVMLELEAMTLDRVRTDVSVQYVDHNLLQADFRNADDHLFLHSACQRFGLWFSRPGNGIRNAVHMQRFGRPGATMAGSDSHTCAAGALGVLAIGGGGLEVAQAMAGEPLAVTMPQVWGLRLVGEFPEWVSAKDVILEMLRRHDVKGGRGRVLEYHGPGLEHLRAMDRHVIANMGAELGATTTVFPSDDEVRRFLASEGRGDAWIELVADDDATYDVEEEIDLSSLEPLIAKPSSPGNVVPVHEVEDEPIYQVVVGSSANPGLRDFATVAEIVKGRQVPGHISFDVNPTSRQTLENLMADGHALSLIHAGARLHQAGCMGCIGMGQAPPTGQNSLRTMPRNFPGRSGTREDRVWLCSPETAAASALTGTITDPRRLTDLFGLTATHVEPPTDQIVDSEMLVPPPESGGDVELVKGPNIESLPDFEPLPDRIEGPVLLKVGDNVSTDEIMPAGQRVLPFRSNIPKMAEFVFDAIDESFPQRALEVRDAGGHVVVGGENYGQGSSREHAAIAPRFLGLRAVIAKNFARIHWQNLVNFGILPLEFADPSDYDRVEQGDVLVLDDVRDTLQDDSKPLVAENTTKGERYELTHHLSPRQVDVILEGGLIPIFKSKLESRT